MIGIPYNLFGQLNIKVLLICPYDLNNHGGVQNQVKLLKKGLINKGIDTKILGPSSLDYDIGQALNIPFNGSKNPITFFPNKKLIKEAFAWADVIHLHEPFIPFMFWRLHTKKKIIVTHHANIGFLIKTCVKFLYLFVKNKNLYSTAVSNEARNNAEALNKDISIIPNMIEINKKIKYVDKDGFLFIGRNEKRKNLKLFIKLAEFYKSKSRFKVITNKISDNNFVTYHLNPSETVKKSLITNVGIYIATNNKSESFGITILEAINQGNVAVCSDIKAFKLLLNDSGIFFKNNNLQDLKQTINKIDQEDMSKIWLNQIEHISNNYSMDKVLQKWIYVYKNL